MITKKQLLLLLLIYKGKGKKGDMKGRDIGEGKGRGGVGRVKDGCDDFVCGYKSYKC